MIIEFRKYSARIGERRILYDIDLPIYERKVNAIIGPSGSGKTTLIRSINRLMELVPGYRYSGDILFDGRSVFDYNVYELRRRIGMVFQHPNPFPHMSIYENVAYGIRLHRLAKSKEDEFERVKHALEQAALREEVKDRLHDKPTRLSGGQKQRLVIARALAVEPEVLLMDEPTASLDPKAAFRIEALMKDLSKEVTIVLVTHNMAQAARVSDYTAFVYRGYLIEHGPTREVFERPKRPETEAFLRGKI